MVNTIFKAMFVKMYVNVVFVKLLVQRNEFNLCYRMALYKSYLSLSSSSSFSSLVLSSNSSASLSCIVCACHSLHCKNEIFA